MVTLLCTIFLIPNRSNEFTVDDVFAQLITLNTFQSTDTWKEDEINNGWWFIAFLYIGIFFFFSERLRNYIGNGSAGRGLGRYDDDTVLKIPLQETVRATQFVVVYSSSSI